MGWFDWRRPRGGIAFMAGLFIFASILLIITGGDSWYTRWVCPFMLPIGIGLWLKHSWARWLTFAFYALLVPAWILVVVNRGISFKQALSGLTILVSLAALWQWDVYPEPEVELDYDEDEMLEILREFNLLDVEDDDGFDDEHNDLLSKYTDE